MDLLAEFVRACREAGATAPDDDLQGAGTSLLERWSSPRRGYHDVLHLTEVLERLDVVGEHAAATRLAAWFHDAVYEGRPGQDERDSADLAVTELTALGIPPETADRVASLVLVTADHEPDDDHGEALCDADLAVLASGHERYAAYVAGVRREYSHVDTDTFRAARAAVLADLLGREHLFRTDHGRRHWDARARVNLAAELTHLRDDQGTP